MKDESEMIREADERCLDFLEDWVHSSNFSSIITNKWYERKTAEEKICCIINVKSLLSLLDDRAKDDAELTGYDQSDYLGD